MYPFFEGITGNKVKHTIYITHRKHLFVKSILQIFDICRRVQASPNVLSAQLLIEEKKLELLLIFEVQILNLPHEECM